MEFAILGSLDVRDGTTPVPIRRGKPAALLALLILRRNQIVSIDRLIEDLWEGQSPQSATKALQTYVSELRRVLPDAVLETRPPGYVLHVPRGGVDSDRFEDAFARGRAALEAGRSREAKRILSEALALWRGAALADFPYDRFAEAERERLEELRRSALEARIEADLARGAAAELVSELQNLVREHPLREGFTRQLMLLFTVRVAKRTRSSGTANRAECSTRRSDWSRVRRCSASNERFSSRIPSWRRQIRETKSGRRRRVSADGTSSRA